MIYRGKVHGGVVILPPEVQLPDGTDVNVQPLTDVQPGPAGFNGAVLNGVPLLPGRDSETVVGMELVNRLRDDVA
jgi:hypothetical protein